MELSGRVCFIVKLIIFVLALILFLCGFGGPNWIESHDDNLPGHAGIWKRCVRHSCDPTDLTDDATPGESLVRTF